MGTAVDIKLKKGRKKKAQPMFSITIHRVIFSFDSHNENKEHSTMSIN